MPLSPVLIRRQSAGKITVPHGFTDGGLRFVWVTDSHNLLNIAGQERDAGLLDAIQDCNEWRPLRFVHTGDIGNDFDYNVKHAFGIMRSHLWRPMLGGSSGGDGTAAIGNHDEYEAVAGSPNTSTIEGVDYFNATAPFYGSEVWTSGDGTTTALVVWLDLNLYDDDPDAAPPGDSANHTPGDRMGSGSGDPETGGGFWRQFGATQLSWLNTTLAADSSDFVILFIHYPPAGVTATDYAAMVDELQTDGRPAIGFCGHAHSNAVVYSAASTDTLYSIPFYKTSALQESFCWVRVALTWTGSAISVDSLDIRNFHANADTDGWTIDTADGWSVTDNVNESPYTLGLSGGVYTVS